MRFSCPYCHTAYRIARERLANRVLRIKCKVCHNTLAIRDPHLKLDSPPQPTQSAAASELPPPPPVDANANWYYAEGRNKIGPLSLAVLREKAESALVSERTYVWNPTMESWRHAGDVEGLAGALQAARRGPTEGHSLPGGGPAPRAWIRGDANNGGDPARREPSQRATTLEVAPEDELDFEGGDRATEIVDTDKAARLRSLLVANLAERAIVASPEPEPPVAPPPRVELEPIEEANEAESAAFDAAPADPSATGADAADGADNDAAMDDVTLVERLPDLAEIAPGAEALIAELRAGDGIQTPVERTFEGKSALEDGAVSGTESAAPIEDHREQNETAPSAPVHDGDDDTVILSEAPELAVSGEEDISPIETQRDEAAQESDGAKEELTDASAPIMGESERPAEAAVEPQIDTESDRAAQQGEMDVAGMVPPDLGAGPEGLPVESTEAPATTANEEPLADGRPPTHGEISSQETTNQETTSEEGTLSPPNADAELVHAFFEEEQPAESLSEVLEKVSSLPSGEPEPEPVDQAALAALKESLGEEPARHRYAPVVASLMAAAAGIALVVVWLNGRNAPDSGAGGAAAAAVQYAERNDPKRPEYEVTREPEMAAGEPTEAAQVVEGQAPNSGAAGNGGETALDVPSELAGEQVEPSQGNSPRRVMVAKVQKPKEEPANGTNEPAEVRPLTVGEKLALGGQLAEATLDGVRAGQPVASAGRPGGAQAMEQEIANVFQVRAKEVHQCARLGAFSGKMVVGFQVGIDGRPTKPDISAQSGVPASTRTCIQELVGKLIFPRPESTVEFRRIFIIE